MKDKLINYFCGMATVFGMWLVNQPASVYTFPKTVGIGIIVASVIAFVTKDNGKSS